MAENNNNGKAATNNGLAVIPERTIADQVLNKVKVFEETGSINLPKDYSAPNALKVAWLMLQDIKDLNKNPVLTSCTKESIANALLKMIVQGLNPAKRQCSFIAYGNQLTCQREYAGTIHIAKRDAGVKTVVGMAVFKDDTFEYEIEPGTGSKKVTKHIQTLESMSSGEVKGAYAIKTYEDGRVATEIMSMQQIRKAWEQGATKGQSPAHKNFPDQMAIKTVINRLLKIDINSSDDGALIDDDVPVGSDDVKMASVKHSISENANKQEIGIDEPVQEATVVENENVDTETGEVKAGEVKEVQTELAGPGF